MRTQQAIRRKVFKGGLDPIAALFANDADGWDFDFTKTDRLFQEPNGPTAANDPGELIGLALDAHSWGNQSLAQIVAAQGEVLSGPWTMSTTGVGATAVESPAGTLQLTGNGSGNVARADISFPTVIGRTYRLALSTVGGAGPGVRIGTTASGNQLLSDSVALGLRTLFFTATTTTTYVQLFRSTAGLITITGLSVKWIPGNHALQGGGSLKPQYQPDGALFDATDDYVLPPYRFQAGENGMTARVKVPASIAASQIVVGARDSGSAGLFYIAFTAGGLLRIGNGVNFNTVGTTDRRGQEVVVSASVDGTTLRAFDDDIECAPVPQGGSVTTTYPPSIGCLNATGSFLGPYGGNIRRVLAYRQGLTLSKHLAIRAKLLAA
jgi:hypothetical protein